MGSSCVPQSTNPQKMLGVVRPGTIKKTDVPVFVFVVPNPPPPNPVLLLLLLLFWPKPPPKVPKPDILATGLMRDGAALNWSYEVAEFEVSWEEDLCSQVRTRDALEKDRTIALSVDKLAQSSIWARKGKHHLDVELR